MNIKEMKQSKYLKQEDVEPPVLATIKTLREENVAPDNKPVQEKYVMSFSEDLKPFVLNTTNIKLIASFLGDETDYWIGKQIVLYNDPSITYGGEVTGGIRVRKPKSQGEQVVPF